MANLEIYGLLLIAVIAGWVLGKIGSSASKSQRVVARDTKDIFNDYFVGLNYLLNDEPDEAIDTFIRALEVDSDTIETHLALGALLRRRGKVDKAIKVHQTLLARPVLDGNFSDSTRLQLALDYIAAGLLDRAERLLKEILDDNRASRWEALQHLVTIYQTEKEWKLAVESMQELLKAPAYKKDAELRSIAGHYCCELALKALEQEQSVRARDFIKKAFGFDRKHVRASLVSATLEKELGNYHQAIKELVRARTSRPEYTQLILQPLIECHEELGTLAELESLLERMYQESPQAELLLAIAKLEQDKNGAESAFRFLKARLGSQATLEGVRELLGLRREIEDNGDGSDLQIDPVIIDTLLSQRSAYQCNHCGYESRNLYWLCPSCQEWDSIKPRVEKNL